MRRIKPLTIYPDETIRSELNLIGRAVDRPPSRMAVRFIKQGIERWKRKQQQNGQRSRATA